LLGAGLLGAQPNPAMLRQLFEQHLEEQVREHGELDARTALAARELGLFLRGAGDGDGAYRAMTRAVAIDEKVFGVDAPRTLADVADLASVAPMGEAGKLFERASKSSDAAAAARALVALGEMHAGNGDAAGAARYWRQAVAKMEPESESAARVMNVLAQVVEPREAIPLLRHALAIDHKVLGARHPEVGATEQLLARALVAAGRAAEAVTPAREALAILSDKLGPEHPRVAAAAATLASVLRVTGSFAEAERLYREALRVDEKVLGPQAPETLEEVRQLAGLLRERGRVQEAVELERRLVVNVAR